MRFQSIIFTTIISCILLSGCVVRKPDSSNISKADYNYRSTVSGAHFRKHVTTAGIGFVIGGAAAGAYWGYNSKMITYQEGPELKPVKPANALIGGVIGLSAASLGNYILGANKTVPVNDPMKWINKANKDYLLLENKSKSEFVVINKNVENNFTVKNIQDLRDFHTVFPGSLYSENVVQKSIGEVNRLQLLEVLEMYPNSSHTTQIQTEYIKRSTSIDDLFAAANQFPATGYDVKSRSLEVLATLSDAEKFQKRFPNGLLRKKVEEKAAGFVISIDDCRTFNRLYPNSDQVDRIVKSLSFSLERGYLPDLVILYPNSPSILLAKKEYIRNSASFLDFIVAIGKYPDPAIGFSSNINYNDLNSAKALNDQLKSLASYLGEANTNRIITSFKRTFLENEYKVRYSIEDYTAFLDMLSLESWLKPESDNFRDLANARISEMQFQIAEQKRKDEFAEALRSGPEALIAFTIKYPTSPESTQAQTELNNYVQSHIENKMDPFYWVAKGDRSFWTAWAEGNRDVWRGSENYNFFVAGRLKNTSNLPLRVKINVSFYYFHNVRVSILYNSTSRERLYQPYYVIIDPYNEAPFIVIFENISGGTQIGTSLLLSGGTNNYVDKDHPFDISYEYLPNEIAQSTIDAQDNLIKNVRDNSGNIKTSDWGNSHSSINDLVASYGSSSGSVALIIHYDSDISSPWLEVKDDDGNSVAQKEWDSSGPKTYQTNLEMNRNYSIEVGGCKREFKLKLGETKTSITIDEDNCTSSIYVEDN